MGKLLSEMDGAASSHAMLAQSEPSGMPQLTQSPNLR
jgi:hypothetical protein